MNNANASLCQDPLYLGLTPLHKLPQTQVHTNTHKPAQFRVASVCVCILGRRRETNAGAGRRTSLQIFQRFSTASYDPTNKWRLAFVN